MSGLINRLSTAIKPTAVQNTVTEGKKVKTFEEIYKNHRKTGP